MLRIMLLSMLAFVQPANAHINWEAEFDPSYTADLEPFAPKGLKSAYLSSVIVQPSVDGVLQGTGSGNYFRLGRHRFILTASHVVEGSDEIWIMEKGYQMSLGKVIYNDPNADIAVIIPNERLKYTKAMFFRRDINNQMGEKVYHCGHPAREAWHISEGLLSGTYTDTLLLNTFAWPGTSGSVVFDESGRVLGIISAVRIDGPFQFPQMVEHIVLASNIKMLDQQTLKVLLENERQKI